jgi:DNA polymerase III delta prime subunit
MSLYQKYRPTEFSQIKGNSDLLQALHNMLSHKETCPHVFLLTGESGCVDCDTEFLSETGWKKISDWQESDLVMQYNLEDKTSEFVKPERYIKRKAKYLYHLKTKYGVNQCLSLNHKFLYFTPRAKIPHTDFFENIIKINNQSLQGFRGKIETVFTPKINTTINLTDAELRVQVMFIADGTIVKNRTSGCVNIKKLRKIERAEYLLKNTNIPYKKYLMSNGFVRFYFKPPLRDKIFSSQFYKCSLKQLNIISDEIFYWDGCTKNNRKSFSTGSLETKDFIQYALASSGYRSSAHCDIRKDRNINYYLICTTRNYVGFTSKNISKLYETKDGFEYCFQVPSSYLVLRREGNIFITGNCGKTTIARIIANRLDCKGNDYVELNASDVRGIDTIREIISNSQFLPIEGNCRVWTIDECAKLTNDAQNAFLKILEDTPPHVYFILCTTDPQKLLETIKGRCSIFQTKPLSDAQMFGVLRRIVTGEKEELQKEVYDQIIQDSLGHARNAIQILEQVLNVPSDRRLEIARQTAQEQSKAIELCRALMSGAKWNKIAEILKGLKDQEPETIRRIVLGYCQAILLSGKDEPLCGLILEEFMDVNFSNGYPQLVKSAYSVTKNK